MTSFSNIPFTLSLKNYLWNKFQYELLHLEQFSVGQSNPTYKLIVKVSTAIQGGYIGRTSNSNYEANINYSNLNSSGEPNINTNVEMKHKSDATSSEKELASTTMNHEGNKIIRLVLRKQPHGKLAQGAHRLDREFFIMNKLRTEANFIWVPKMIDYCSDKSVIGTEFFIMEYIEGRFFKDLTMEESTTESISQEAKYSTKLHSDFVSNIEMHTRCKILTAGDRRELYISFLRSLADLHAVNVDNLNLGGFAKYTNDPNDYFRKQIHVWTRQYRYTETGENPSVNRLIQWLEDDENIPLQKDPAFHRNVVCHGDYKIDNIIFDKDRNCVKAIIDWELCTVGHPLADLGFLCALYHMPPNMPGISNKIAEGVPDEIEVLDLYSKMVGAKAAIENFHFYIVFSLFRLIGIIQGVYKRSILGNASSPRANEFGSVITPLAQIAWGLIEKNDRKILQKIQGISFSHTHKFEVLRNKLTNFMNEHIYPAEETYRKQQIEYGKKWKVLPIIEELKAKAKQAGLWNFFLHKASGLKMVEYAALAEIQGRVLWSSEVFNCNAPDTGNAEVLDMFGTEEQKRTWLVPLLEGEIRSCFAMTEPLVASSDARNISCSIKKSSDGKNYIINGRKWYITGAAHPKCAFAIVMGITDRNAPAYRQQSMVIVPMNSSGLSVVRPLDVFGAYDEPYGHCEMTFENVSVPITNIISGEGKGFEIAQKRLGNGRIHHCMRVIGFTERALEDTCKRALSRFAFGASLSSNALIASYIADSRIEIEQCRLLVQKCAYDLDQFGNQVARSIIAQIKVAVPRMSCKVLDRCMQIYGAAGLNSEVTHLPELYIAARSLRVADGPDEVHLHTIAKLEFMKYKEIDPLEKQFLDAQRIYATIRNKIDQKTSATLAGLYKQATLGDCLQSDPPKKNLDEWQAWVQLRQTPPNKAKERYIQIVKVKSGSKL